MVNILKYDECDWKSLDGAEEFRNSLINCPKELLMDWINTVAKLYLK